MIRTTFILLFLVLGSTFASAQSNANSPYSRFGIGDPVDFHTMYMRSMGGAAAGYFDPYHINLSNPASYSALRATAFDVGVFANYTRLSDDTSSDNLWNGNLGYMSLAFPLKNPFSSLLDRSESPYKFAMAFALIPNTDVGYNITSFETNPEIGQIERNFSGSGGSSKFIWGNSMAYKNYHFGLNLGYLFGNIDYSRFAFFNDIPASFDNDFSTSYTMNGLYWNAGFLYRKTLNKKDVEENRAAINEITFGFYGKTNTSFSTEADILDRSILILNGQELNSDTLRNESGIEGSGTLPAEFAFGLNYFRGNKYSVGFEIAQTYWSQYKNDANPETLDNSFRVSFGGYLRPNYKSYNNFFKRVFYRYGLYYNTDPRVVGQEQVKTYGATFGMGMPFVFQRKVSHANLGIEFGRKGSGSLIEETFAKISFSFTFNDDEWFIKRKYN